MKKATKDKYELPLEIKKTKEKQKNKKMGKENQLSSVPTAGCCCRSTCLSIYLGYITASRDLSLTPQTTTATQLSIENTRLLLSTLLSYLLLWLLPFSFLLPFIRFFFILHFKWERMSLSCYVLSEVFPFFQNLSVRQAR